MPMCRSVPTPSVNWLWTPVRVTMPHVLSSRWPPASDRCEVSHWQCERMPSCHPLEGRVVKPENVVISLSPAFGPVEVVDAVDHFQFLQSMGPKSPSKWARLLFP